MSHSQNEKRPTIAGSGISKNIHISGVNDPKVSTAEGEKEAYKFICEALTHHSELLQRHAPLQANDYPELDYTLHKRLMKKEFEQGGTNG